MRPKESRLQRNDDVESGEVPRLLARGINSGNDMEGTMVEPPMHDVMLEIVPNQTINST
jgi:hypothetical protein